MQPQQPVSQSPYDFIVNPPPPVKTNPLSNLPVGRRLIFLIFIIILITILLITAGSLLGRGNKGLTVAYTTVGRRQQEIIRLTASAQQGANIAADTSQFVQTANLSLTSSQQQLYAYAKSQRISLNKKTIGLVDPKPAQQLTAAAANGDYDLVFNRIIQNELTAYEADLSKAYSQTKGPKGKALLKTEYQNVELLKKQLPKR